MYCSNNRCFFLVASQLYNNTVASVLETISNHLCDTYKRTRFTPKGAEWPPNIPKLIVSVALIHYKGKRTQQELFEMATIHKEGSLAIDKFTSLSQEPSTMKPRLDYSKITRNVTDIFAADPTNLTEVVTSSTKVPKRILIEGAPGIGKTVLAKEIAYQWAANEMLTEIKNVFLLYLRDPQLQSIITTKQLVKYMSMGCLDDEQITTFNKYLVNTKGQQLCIVMDGFDEYPNTLQKYSLIADIINRAVLPEAIVVITSRPTATVSLHDKVDKRIDILGLPKEEQEKYISQALSSTPDKKVELERHLKQRPVISGLCFVPLNLAILLYLLQQGCLPETLTEMNESFILHTIYRHLEKHGITPSGPVNKLAKVPKLVLDIVYQLAKLAFNGLQGNKLVFTFDEVKEVCPHVDETVGAINGFGLLQAVQHYPSEGAGTTTSLNFLHYTMQEFLSALHVSDLPSEQQSSLMKRTFWDGHYNFMWMMFVGIVGIKSDIFISFVSKGKVDKGKSGIRIAENILKDKRKRLHVFQCYMEAKSSAEAPDVISDMFKDGKIDIEEVTLLPHHISSLMTYVSNSSMQWNTLQLNQCNITDIGMSVLEQFISEKTSTLEYVDLRDNNSSPWGVYCAIIRHCSVDSLTLCGDHGMEDYVNEIKQSLQMNTKLISLTLCNIANNRSKIIAEAIQVNTTLQKLDISNNSICDDGVIAISNSLKYNISLQELNMSRNEITSEGIKKITTAIQINDTLKQLDLSINKINDEGANFLSDGLKNNISLLKLNISHSNITDRGIEVIAKAIQINSTLQNIDISKNHISTDGLLYFMEAVKSNCTLQVVNITHNNVTTSGFTSIKQCIENLQYPIQVITSWNEIREGGKLVTKISTSCAPDNIEEDVWSRDAYDADHLVMCLSECLKENHSVQKVYSSYYLSRINRITSEGAFKFAEAIKVNKTLQELDISSNNISDNGAAAISDALKSNNSLQILNMSFNNITSEGAKVIAEAIKVNRTLHTLDLYEHDINDAVSFNMIILTAVYHNNTLMTMKLPFVFDDDDMLVRSEVEKVNNERKRQGIRTLTCPL